MKYRADIDGIRAIAISIVIFFHFGFGGFNGGFIGVDVFFVLSGYLISSVIFEQLKDNRFSFSTFYFRRIRRLFPVYLFVLLVMCIVAYICMLPRDFRDVGATLFASAAYISNILFYIIAGYFDTASHLKPLLHTWSLSVEEQFYVVFPIVAFLTARLTQRSLFIFFSILTLVSFMAAVLYIESNQNAVFYLYPFRAWEMFLGTLLATSYIPKITSKHGNNAAAIIGLLCILVPTFYYDETTLFPGLTALLPCLGTVLIIQSHSWVHQLLATKVPVFIGKISYSLYLWHWPIFVLYSYNSPHGTDGTDTIIMLAATVFASIISWRYVEAPFRSGKIPFSNNKLFVFIATGVLTLMFMGAGLFIFHSDGMPNRLDEKTARFDKAGGDLFGNLERCKGDNNSELPNIPYCPIGEPFESKKYTLIWGDSHSAVYKRGFTDAIKGKNRDAVLAWMGGCPPVFGVTKDETVSSKVIDDQCPTRNQAVLELLKNDARIDSVILIGRWSYYINGGGVGIDAHNRIKVWPVDAEPSSITDQSRYFVDTFNETINTLNAMGKKVFVVEQPPEFSRYNARRVAISLMNGSADNNGGLSELTVESYPAVLTRQGPIQNAFILAEQRNEIALLRTHKQFCNNVECSLMFGDSPIYFDNNHISSAGSVQINAMFDPFIHYLDTLSE